MSDSNNSIPENVIELAHARIAARAAKDWALADQLRAQIADAGYDVKDVAGGFELTPRQAFPVIARIGDMRKFTEKEYEISVGIYVDGFIEDAVDSIKAIQKHSADTCAILIVISGALNPEELSSLKSIIDARTYIVQISEGVGFGEATNAILKFASSPYVVLMDPSTRFLGDAITPALKELQSGEWSTVGWRGGLVDVEDEWRSVNDKGPGAVDVLFGYFLGVNRSDAIECGGFNNRAVYYRNADIEFSLRLRQAQGNLLQMELPLEQARHHGYYDTDPEYRDEQSRKNYERILERFRGKNEILVPRR